MWKIFFHFSIFLFQEKLEKIFFFENEFLELYLKIYLCFKKNFVIISSLQLNHSKNLKKVNNFWPVHNTFPFFSRLDEILLLFLTRKNFFNYSKKTKKSFVNFNILTSIDTLHLVKFFKKNLKLNILNFHSIVFLFETEKKKKFFSVSNKRNFQNWKTHIRNMKKDETKNPEFQNFSQNQWFELFAFS